MTTRDRHDEPQSPTTATQFSPPRTTSYTNRVNGNHPGTRVQDGDSVRLNVAPNVNEVNENHPGALAQDRDVGRLNAAPNGALATNTSRCIRNAYIGTVRLNTNGVNENHPGSLE
jgi:hypothetical protein